jgi:L-threonylcarbamoyladenylate synthase
MQFSSDDIVLYPTDTVYGLGVDATDADAVRRLRNLKGRDEKKPISIIVTDMAMAGEYAVVTPLGQKLADKFLPGKLSIVLTAKDNLPVELTAGTGTVAIRIPDHPIPIALVRKLGRPITATSANVADMPTERTVEKILAQFGMRSAMIYHYSSETDIPESLPSTLVDARGNSPVILREGVIPVGQILSATKEK